MLFLAHAKSLFYPIHIIRMRFAIDLGSRLPPSAAGAEAALRVRGGVCMGKIRVGSVYGRLYFIALGLLSHLS